MRLLHAGYYLSPIDFYTFHWPSQNALTRQHYAACACKTPDPVINSKNTFPFSLAAIPPTPISLALPASLHSATAPRKFGPDFCPSAHLSQIASAPLACFHSLRLAPKRVISAKKFFEEDDLC